MTGNVIETVMGGVVLVVAAPFLFFAYSTSQLHAVQGYEVTAHSSASTGSRKAATCASPASRSARSWRKRSIPRRFSPRCASASIRPISCPTTRWPRSFPPACSATVTSHSFPAARSKTIPPGGRIKDTQSPVSLENLIGQMIFSQPGAQKKPEEGRRQAPPKKPWRVGGCPRNSDLAHARGRAGLLRREDQGAEREPRRAARAGPGGARGRRADGLRRGSRFAA